MLGGDLGLELLRDARWSLAVAVTAGIIAVYHFLVLREDQAALPAETAAIPAPPREVILVSAALTPDLVADIERIPGVHVRA